MRYLFNDKIQIGYNDQFCFGLFSPRKESGDPDCFKYCLCIGKIYICWGE